MSLKLELDSERNAELRVALSLREDQLKKLRKNLEDAKCTTHDVVRRLALVDLMKAATEEAPELPLNGRREVEGQLPLQTEEEALRGVEEEAARRIRDREI